MYRLAAERMTVAGARHLTDLLNLSHSVDDPIETSVKAAEREFALAEMARNPFLTMVHMVAVRFLTNLVPFELMTDERRVQRAKRQMNQVVRNVIAGDAAAAQRHSAAFNTEMVKRLREWRA